MERNGNSGKYVENLSIYIESNKDRRKDTVTQENLINIWVLNQSYKIWTDLYMDRCICKSCRNIQLGIFSINDWLGAASSFRVCVFSLQGLLWWEGGDIFFMAGVLHLHVDSSSHCRRGSLHLWTGHHNGWCSQVSECSMYTD